MSTDGKPPGDGPRKLSWIEKVRAAKATPEGRARLERLGIIAEHAAQPPRRALDHEYGAAELEAWAKAGIDACIDEVEAASEGTRNAMLNIGALRAFRLALTAGYDLDGIHDELFAAARTAGHNGSHPHTDRQIRATLRSARDKAIEDGPADPPDDHDRVIEVDLGRFGADEDEDETDMTDDDQPEPGDRDESDPYRDFDDDADEDDAGKTYTRGAPDPGHDAAGYETAITRRAAQLRVELEARRRVDDEMRPAIQYPPVRSLTALLAEPDTPARYRIDQVAPADARIMLSAQYKAGKSTLVGNLIRALADAEPFLGHFDVPAAATGVVLIDDEMSPNTLRPWLRAQGIANTGNVADVITLRGNVGAFNLLDGHCRAAWAKRLAGVGCDYLILDCLRPVLDALGLDENHDAGRFLVAFDALLADAGVRDACLLQHMGHTGERARGDSRLQDWPDAIWHLVREDDDPGSVRYFSAYGRDVDAHEGRLHFDPDTRHLTYMTGSRNDAKTEAALLAIIGLLAENARNHGDGLSGQGIASALAMDHPRKAVRDALKKALRATMPRIGVNKSGPHGAHLHYLLHPCQRCGMPVTDGGPRHFSCPESDDE